MVFCGLSNLYIVLYAGWHGAQSRIFFIYIKTIGIVDL